MLRLTVALLLGVLAHQTCADEPEAIVGGTLAAPGEFPYQCSMNLRGSHACGCSILNPTKILTAAHCLEGDISPSDLYIRTGSIQYNRLGKTYLVKSFKMHPEYQPGAWYSWNNDIAVITLQNPIEFSPFEAPVELASSPPQPNTKCVLSGWGKTSAGGRLSVDLLKMNTMLIDTRSCKRKLGVDLYDSHLCAFNTLGIGACQGDSGGPLVCNGKQYGITSFVMPCAVGKPDVFTSVYNHLNFIRSETQN